jgi:hypothetical protein
LDADGKDWPIAQHMSDYIHHFPKKAGFIRAESV